MLFAKERSRIICKQEREATSYSTSRLIEERGHKKGSNQQYGGFEGRCVLRESLVSMATRKRRELLDDVVDKKRQGGDVSRIEDFKRIL